MGLLGAAIGGGLQGLGTGMVNDAIQRRNEALEAMKLQAEESRQRAGFQQQERMAGVQHDNRLDEIGAEGDNRIRALRVGGAITQDAAATQHKYKLGEIEVEQVGRKELAVLGSRLKIGETAAELKLRDDLDSGKIDNLVRDDNGMYIGITKTGAKITTGVKADPTSAEKNSNGGGVLTDSDKASALADAEKAWRDGGKAGARPKASDFIGMTQLEYREKYVGGTAKPATGPTNGPAATTPQKSNLKPISASERTALYTQALTKGQGGDPRFHGKTPSQIQAIIDDGLRNKGYDL